MMYLQTPKRPSLPPTPSSYNGGKPTSLPPLLSILNMTKDQFSGAASSTPFSVPSNNNHHYLPKLSSMDFTPSKPIHSNTYPRPYPMPTPIADTSDPDISITDMRRSVRSSAPAAMPPISRNPSVSSLPAPASHPQVAATAAGAKDSKSFAFISHSPSTFPLQEPAIDNAPLARRKRRRTSPNELSILNTEFEAGSTPNKLRRIEIAAKVCMTEKAVQIWFQNKRQSLRKQSSHEKEITELPPTPPIIILQQRQAPAPAPMPLPLVSSTPTKPIMQKSHSFMGSPSVALPPSASTSSPIKQRSRSIPIFKSEDADSSIDDSMMANTTGLVLNKTRKKQPVLLNSNNTSTMTFKLAPSTHATNTTNKINQRLTIAATADDASNSNKENSSNLKPTTAAKSDRKPLSQINANGTSTASESTKLAVVENLLSLRTGNWA